jgi:ribose transport system ATP-binding protein
MAESTLPEQTAQAAEGAPPILRMTHISKGFPGVQALRDVHLEVRQGEVHALIGENGAGKSTLMKILAGVYHPDSGTIEIEGRPVKIDSPNQALALGIGIIHQELNLAPNISAAENICLGHEPQLFPGWADFNKMNQKAERVLRQLGATFPPTVLVGRLSTGQQQVVEIAKALSEDARILVMDEPTASLSEREAVKLFELVRTLRSRGITIIYISHRMAEVYDLSDRITVLRDGQYVDTLERGAFTDEIIIQRMVGRSLGDLYDRRGSEAKPKASGEFALEVRNLSNPYVKSANLNVRRGEIVGLAGLVGAGRTTLARLLFGAERRLQGEILIEGKPVNIQRPLDAIRAGIGLVPESRKEQGLFLQLSVQENIVMNSLSKLAAGGVIDFSKARQLAEREARRLRIRMSALPHRVLGLSGGNQQKVVLAKWLTINPKLLILDEPTRGVDVGAKAEIYAIMHQLAHEGMGILMISSDLPEVLGMSDRIVVMHEGRIMAELPGYTTTQEEIMLYATGLAA